MEKKIGFVESNIRKDGVSGNADRWFIALFSFQREFVEKERKICVERRSDLGALAQLARAPALQAGCRGFEPLRLHQKT